MTKGFDPDLENRDIILQDESPLKLYLEKNPLPCDISHLETIPELKEDLERLSMLEPKLLVPMKSKDALNGIIVLGQKLIDEAYSTNEKEFLQDLGKFAAIAVENSRLYLMATLDRMTRLYIHHYFQERLLEETKRSARNNTPLCLIMSDIDHFKKFNDTYGHQQGDIVLKETALIYKKLVRSIDIPARYGGEEFAVILPETEFEDAIAIAERLRKQIELYEFPGQKKPLHVTISLGVALYDPERDRSKDDLIKRADEALYMAKEAGRNKVIASK